MSTRFGMQDGRCFTISTASGLFNNYLMKENGISYVDNYSYRQLLQSQGPAVIEKVLKKQGQSDCAQCDLPLLNVKGIY
jgi:hypothetical protein